MTTTRTPQTVPAIVTGLRRRGVQLAVTPDDGLGVDAPPGVLTPDDLTILRALKAAIVAHLRLAEASAASAPAPAEGVGDVANADVDDALTCVVPGCTAVVDAYDAHGRGWCTAHRPDIAVEPTPEPPPWRCACGGEVSGRLPRCPKCLRQRDGRPSPCTVCQTPVVRRPPPPRDVGLRTPVGEEPVATGPGLEVFCSAHRRGGHLLHVACARNWPAFTVSDGEAIDAGRAAWLAAVTTHTDEAWYVRALVELGYTPPAPPSATPVLESR
jgi:hypothetical protein